MPKRTRPFSCDRQSLLTAAWESCYKKANNIEEADFSWKEFLQSYRSQVKRGAYQAGPWKVLCSSIFKFCFRRLTRLAAQGRRKNRLKLCDSPEFLLDLRHTDKDSPAPLVSVRNFYQSQWRTSLCVCVLRLYLPVRNTAPVFICQVYSCTACA